MYAKHKQPLVIQSFQLGNFAWCTNLQLKQDFKQSNPHVATVSIHKYINMFDIFSAA